MSDAQAQRTKSLLQQLTKAPDVTVLFAPGRVQAGISEHAARSVQGQWLFSFLINLLARGFPVVQELVVVVPPGSAMYARLPRWTAATLDAHLATILRELNSPIRWCVVESLSDNPGLNIWVGARPPLDRQPTVFVGADAWNSHVSPAEPLAVGGANPIGAYAAACLGVAEIWKRLLLPHQRFFPHIPIIPCDRTITFSTFTYRAQPGEPNPDLPNAVDLSRLTLVGLGAGGGAAAYSLASLPKVRGLLNLIEPDEVEDPNLNRYVYAADADAKQHLPKIVVLERCFGSHPEVTVRPLANPFREARTHLTAADLEFVLAAVHSREARRELQYETPRVLWDAGATPDGEFRVWRHILGETDCMFCKHPISADEPEVRKAQQLTQLVGLTPEIWLRKVCDNERFTEAEIAELERRRPQDAAFDLPKPGQRFGDWEAEQCGRMKLPDLEDEIPLPFAPVLAGVLIAGEIVKEHYFPDAVLDSYYWNTLLGRYMLRNSSRRRLPRPDCTFCTDEAYRQQYQRLWGGAAR